MSGLLGSLLEKVGCRKRKRNDEDDIIDNGLQKKRRQEDESGDSESDQPTFKDLQSGEVVHSFKKAFVF